MSTRTQLRIAFASHTPAGGLFAVGSHHLSEELALQGHTVAHVARPISIPNFFRRSTNTTWRFRLWRSGGNMSAAGVWNYQPLSILPWRVARRLTSGSRRPYLWTLPDLHKVLSRHAFDEVDALIVDEPLLEGIERLFKTKVVAYRATDLYYEMTGDMPLRKAEDRMLLKADGIIGTSGPVLDSLRKRAPEKPTLLLENGVDYGHFSTNVQPPPEYMESPRPRAIYIGSLDDRFDHLGFHHLVKTNPGVDFVVIGPTSKNMIHSTSNLRVLGPRPYARLPAYLQHARVALLPLSAHPANAGRSPMKLYEYMAAGLPVVARRTPELIRRGEPGVHLYESPPEMTAALEKALSDAPPADILRSVAARHAWTKKVELLEKFIRQLLNDSTATKT